jgi:hypothetical protein
MSAKESFQQDKDIRQEEAIKNLLARMPKGVSDSFSDMQLLHLKMAIGSRQWGQHKIDIRSTVTLPFTRWRYYYVFLAGRNRRQLSEREKKISFFITALLVFGFILVSIAVGLLCIYLMKSFAGIDLFPGFSFGIWDYFKE